MTTAWQRGASLLPPPKFYPLSVGIGAAAGAMAIAFDGSVRLATRWLLGPAGFFPATIAGDGGFHPASGFAWPWAIPLLAAAGALAAAALVFRTAPETEGHGTDVAIRSINTDPTGMRIRAMPVKMIASAITIGSGGSGGSEGPTAQMAATAASFIARWRILGLDYRQARMAVTAGLAAGVGAIFRAPFGGALLGVELLFRRDREWQMLVPSLIASSVAYAEFGAVYGYTPMFGHVPGMRVIATAQLLVFPLLGLFCGLLARLYTWLLYGVGKVAARWRIWKPLRPSFAGLLTGTLGLLVPGVLGTGYGTIQYVLSPQRVLHLSLALLIVMPLAKIVGTSLTVGSGGSGGVFGPCMVIGATAGALLWRLGTLAGMTSVIPDSPALLAVAGMAACLGAAAHSPLAITLIAAETSSAIWGTGNYWVLAAAMLSVPVAAAVMRDDTLYRSQPRDRSELAADLERPAPTAGEIGAPAGAAPAGAAPASAMPRPGQRQRATPSPAREAEVPVFGEEPGLAEDSCGPTA
jgi:chloride channel protein, CIC family